MRGHSQVGAVSCSNQAWARSTFIILHPYPIAYNLTIAAIHVLTLKLHERHRCSLLYKQFVFSLSLICFCLPLVCLQSAFSLSLVCLHYHRIDCFGAVLDPKKTLIFIIFGSFKYWLMWLLCSLLKSERDGNDVMALVQSQSQCTRNYSGQCGSWYYYYYYSFSCSCDQMWLLCSLLKSERDANDVMPVGYDQVTFCYYQQQCQLVEIWVHFWLFKITYG